MRPFIALLALLPMPALADTAMIADEYRGILIYDTAECDEETLHECAGVAGFYCTEGGSLLARVPGLTNEQLGRWLTKEPDMLELQFGGTNFTSGGAIEILFSGMDGTWDVGFDIVRRQPVAFGDTLTFSSTAREVTLRLTDAYRADLEKFFATCKP